MELRDLGFIGYLFTWHKGNGDRGGVEERLDWALVSHGWVSQFSNCQVYHFSFILSDHSPLVIDTHDDHC